MIDQDHDFTPTGIVRGQTCQFVYSNDEEGGLAPDDTTNPDMAKRSNQAVRILSLGTRDFLGDDAVQEEWEVRFEDGFIGYAIDHELTPIATKHPVTGNDVIPVPLVGTFRSPFTTGPENCPDIQSRNGHTFELLAEVWDPAVPNAEDLPLATIRFPDGLEILAWPEEIGWGS